MIPVRGYIEPAIAFDLPAITFQVIQNQPYCEIIPVQLAKGLNADVIDVVTPVGVPIGARIITDKSGRSSARIEWKGTDKAGWHRYSIIFSGRGQYSAGISVPIAVEVRPVIEPQPSILCIQESEIDKPWSRQVRVPRNMLLRDSNLECKWDNDAFSVAITASKTVANNGDIIVTLKGDPERTRTIIGQQGLGRLKSSNGYVGDFTIYIGKASFGKVD